jgi:hypothetical protein
MARHDHLLAALSGLVSLCSDHRRHLNEFMDSEIKKQEFETVDEFYSLINLMDSVHLPSSSSSPVRKI